MTLRIVLSNVIDIPKNGTIFVTGSQAGPLISKTSIIGYPFICSVTDILTISFFEEVERINLIGEVMFSPARFVRENKYNPNLYEDEEIFYQTHIFDFDEKPCGAIKLAIKYNAFQQYFGEKIGTFESFPEQQPLKIGRQGAHQVKNIFNCIDPQFRKTSFSCMEQPYRDNAF